MPPWRGRWTAADAAAAATGASNAAAPDPRAVFAAHLSAGWTLRSSAGTNASEGEGEGVGLFYTALEPPKGPRDGTHACRTMGEADVSDDDGLQPLRLAYGLVPPTPARCDGSVATNDDDARVRAARWVGQMAGAVSAARLAGTIVRHRRWCLDAVRAAERAATMVAGAVGSGRQAAGGGRGGSVGFGPAGVDAAARLVHAAREKLMVARGILDGDDGSGDESEDGEGDDGRSDDVGVEDPFAAAMAAMMGVSGVSGGGTTRRTHPTRRRGVERTIGAAAVVELAVTLDDVMYELAYHARACGWIAAPGSGLGERASRGVDPAAYLAAVTECAFTGTSGAAAAAAEVMAGDNPLLALLHSRLREGARLLLARGLPAPADVLEVARADADARGGGGSSGRKKKSKRTSASGRATEAERADAEKSSSDRSFVIQPPPCPPLVQRWRDSTRAWPCHLYAYAAPTPAALEALREASDRWLEVGAGLGYWAALMQKRGMDVVPVDSHPTTAVGQDTDGEGKAKGKKHKQKRGWKGRKKDGRGAGCDTAGASFNEYHGAATPFTTVYRGGPAAAAADEHAGRALFLCYPPPADPMGSDALRAHADAGGETVAVVGEWDGNTGDGALSAALVAGYSLVRRVQLPQWGDTAHELTIWSRRVDREEDAKRGKKRTRLRIARCSHCGKPSGRAGCDGVGEKRKSSAAGRAALRRCRYCRVALYCSAECAAEHAEDHAEVHALRHVPFPDRCGKPDFGDDDDFKDFTPFA